MTGLELYKGINQTIDILVWPLFASLAVFIFRKQLAELFSRITDISGKVGKVDFKIRLTKKLLGSNLTKAVELEKVGKTGEAKQLVAETEDLISDIYMLTDSDIDYLRRLAQGEPPKRRWGPTHLVRGGFVEFDGGNLTDKGRSLVDAAFRS